MDDVGATLASAAISTVIASFVAWKVGTAANRTNQKATLDNLFVKIIELAIQYPYLENDAYCGMWPDVDGSIDNRMRYDNYCCLVFNALESTWRHHNGDRAKIRDDFNIDEMVWRHRHWWQAENENRIGYPLGFRSAVDAIIDRISREARP